MKRRLLASLLTLVMILSFAPATALAAEPCTITEGCILETGHEDECVTTPDEPEEPADEPAKPTVVEQLQEQINALPGADELADMDEDEQAEVYAEVCDIYDAIDELTVEEANALNVSALEEAATFFTRQIMPLEGETSTEDGTQEHPWNISAEGNGNDVTAYLSEDKSTLTISGTGAMEDFATKNDIPWASSKTQITQVTIEGSVTTIGARSFFDCTNIASIVIPEGITSIGDHAFRNTGLISVTIPASVTEIGPCAFSYNEKLITIDVNNNNTIYRSTDGIVYKNVNGK